jgi:hypothetical protein
MNPLDLSTDLRCRQVRKRVIPMSVTFAVAPGRLQTLEGPVPYKAGDAIMTGVKGEHWPVERHRFLERYEPSPGTNSGEDGTYTRRPEDVLAVQLTSKDEPMEITTQSGGQLTAREGDWLVQYAPGDFGVVDPEIFEETYEDVN